MNKMMPMAMMMVIMLVSLVYVIVGVNMHQRVFVEEQKFHDLQSRYFIIDKQTREAAPTNSELNQQLVLINNYPSELLRLKLVGVGRILTGIYALLFGILIALIMMPMRLGKIIKASH